MRAHIRAWLGLAGTMGISACGSATGVSDRFSATYVLERVNGRPAPAVSAQGDGYRVTVLADTLVFTADGFVERRNRVRYVGVLSSSADTTFYQSGKYQYTIDGTRLTIGMSCPPNANCVGSSHGYIDSRGIDLTDVGMGDAALHYARR